MSKLFLFWCHLLPNCVYLLINIQSIPIYKITHKRSMMSMNKHTFSLWNIIPHLPKTQRVLDSKRFKDPVLLPWSPHRHLPTPISTKCKNQLWVPNLQDRLSFLTLPNTQWLSDENMTYFLLLQRFKRNKKLLRNMSYYRLQNVNVFIQT